MDTQPSYRLRHTGTGLGLEEGVGEPPVAERVGSVPELQKITISAIDLGTQDNLPTLWVQHRRTDVRLYTVFILAILPLFARVVT